MMKVKIYHIFKITIKNFYLNGRLNGDGTMAKKILSPRDEWIQLVTNRWGQREGSPVLMGYIKLS